MEVDHAQKKGKTRLNKPMANNGKYNSTLPDNIYHNDENMTCPKATAVELYMIDAVQRIRIPQHRN